MNRAEQEWAEARPVPILPDVYLGDDGTLDTVFYCSDCGAELRYSSELFERCEETGALVNGTEAIRTAAEDHAEQGCEPEETED